MLRKTIFIMTFMLMFAGCASAETPDAPTPTPQVLDVYASAATQSWLNELYSCTTTQIIIIRVSDSPSTADIQLRLGEPAVLDRPAFQIDSEEILVVTNRQSPVQNLSVDEVRALFAGYGSSDVEVWVFAEGEDVQQVFDDAVMSGQLVTSQARLATSPQQMGDTINNTPNTVGILPKHWKAGDSRFVYTIPDVPVLAILKNEPQGALKDMLACMQQKTAP
jgi:hypothetical protein